MRAQRTTARQGLSPLRAFAVVATLAALTGTALYLSSRDATQDLAPNPPAAVVSPSPTVDAPPTDAEAISIFRALDKKRVAAYAAPEEADITEFLGADSPLLGLGKREFARLQRQRVHIDISTRPGSISVIKVSAGTLVVREIVEQKVRVVGEDGQSLTKNPVWERRHIRWTLQRYGAHWKIYNSKLLRAREVA